MKLLFLTLTLLPFTSLPHSLAAEMPAPTLSVVASTKLSNWNGVAVSKQSRIFADFPRFGSGKNPSLVEIVGKKIKAFPGGEWNEWVPGQDPRTRFVSINAVYINRADDHLWVVDSGTPDGGPAIAGAPKLVEIDLGTNQVVNTFLFDDSLAPAASHLNDIRISGDMVYVTESGVGTILTLNRSTKVIRRLLVDSFLTKADPSVHPTMDSKPVVNAKGEVPKINADQIELTADGKTLFFMSPFGPNLYEAATADLNNESLSEMDLENKIKVAQKVNPSGGIVLGPTGDFYFSEFSNRSIRCTGPDGKTKWEIKDRRLVFPDAYSIGPDGTFYVAISQNVKMPDMNHGKDERKPPYLIMKFHP